MQNLIVQGQLPISDIIQFNTNYSHSNVESRFEQLKSILKYDFNKTTQWYDIRIYTQESNSIATKFISKYQDIMNMRKGYCNYESAISDLELLISLNVLNGELAAQKEAIYSLYKDYYNGIETDWDKLIEALKYAVDLRQLIVQSW